MEASSGWGQGAIPRVPHLRITAKAFMIVLTSPVNIIVSTLLCCVGAKTDASVRKRQARTQLVMSAQFPVLLIRQLVRH